MQRVQNYPYYAIVGKKIIPHLCNMKVRLHECHLEGATGPTTIVNLFSFYWV